MTIGLIEQKLDATDRSRAPAEITDCSSAGSGISRILQPSVFQDGAWHKLPTDISTGCPFDRPQPTVIETHMSMKQLLARHMVWHGTAQARTPGNCLRTGHRRQDSIVPAGSSHICLLLAGGQIQCCGRNDSGQLGDGTLTNQALPEDVIGMMMPATGIATEKRHTCAVTMQGGLTCWGSNHDGRLEDGTTDDQVTPNTVAGLTSGMRDQW